MLTDFNKLSRVLDLLSAVWDTIAKLGNLGLSIEAKYWRLVNWFVYNSAGRTQKVCWV